VCSSTQSIKYSPSCVGVHSMRHLRASAPLGAPRGLEDGRGESLDGWVKEWEKWRWRKNKKRRQFSKKKKERLWENERKGAINEWILWLKSLALCHASRMFH
jgi:hypothetical protein